MENFLRRAMGWSVSLVFVLVGLLVGPLAEPAAADPRVDAARADGKVVWYTSIGLATAETVAAMFEERYGIPVEVNRSGAERIFSRYMQEVAAGIHEADVIHTADTGHFEYMKQQGLLRPYAPPGAERFADYMKDPDGYWYVWRASLSVPAYNPNLIPAGEVPRTWLDMLDPKWKGRMVKAHPGYSGTVVVATLALSKIHGWEFFERLARLDVMQLQSSDDPPRIVASGERELAFESSHYATYQVRAAGNPVQEFYPEEGVPFVVSPTAILARAPRPRAAELFTDFIFSPEVQRVLTENGFYVPDPDISLPADMVPLTDLKLLIVSPDELLARADEVKERYVDIFGL